jgi:hypothetical protein
MVASAQAGRTSSGTAGWTLSTIEWFEVCDVRDTVLELAATPEKRRLTAFQ